MNKYFGDYPAKILSVDKESKTARVSIEPFTKGLAEGVTATFAFPVGHDDRDTEIEVLEGAECYVFFLQGEPHSPVIWSYRSHGKGSVVDYRRIRQENIELLARNQINIEAQEELNLTAKRVTINATEQLIINANSKQNGTQEVTGKSTLAANSTIGGMNFSVHYHIDSRNGNTSGPRSAN